MNDTNQHYIAIIGGSVAGSEAAHQLANKGFKVAVFDQMRLPYGKIEDGLPKWHIKLRDKEENAIDQKLQHPNIRFIPKVRLGRDIDFNSLVEEWGFSAVLLAIGAWNDRQLSIPGIEKFTNKGLLYQNQMIKWFNHCHEKSYSGPNFELPDNAIVIGGGLASIDVIKIVQILTVQRALLKKGIKENIFNLERGIDRVLDKHNLSMSDLGLKGATLFYRKSAQDMPLKPFNTEEQREKARIVSEKMLNITKKRYKFNFSPNSIPVNSIVASGKLTGIVFQQTKVIDGQSIPIEGSEFEFKSSLVISSIGSLPEQLKGVPMKKDLLSTTGIGGCRVLGYEHVFALGNAVTGRGNIKESRDHGRESANSIIENHLDPKLAQFETDLRILESKVDLQVDEISESIGNSKSISAEAMQAINDKITKLQKTVGYDEDYFKWKEKVLWERLEGMPDKMKK